MIVEFPESTLDDIHDADLAVGIGDCARCGGPQRGYAGIGDDLLCHPSCDCHPDCYTLPRPNGSGS